VPTSEIKSTLSSADIERIEALAKSAPARAQVLAADTVLALCALAREVERLRYDCAEAYQVIGAGLVDPPMPYTQDDVVRALDNLVAAANGDPRPHDDLLPWPASAANK
jgi:hypothetical protein